MVIRQKALAVAHLVEIEGRIDQQATDELEALLRSLIDGGNTQLIIDFTATSYINSSGLRCLIFGWRRAQAAGGDLVLCGMEGRIQNLFQMIGFDHVFKIFPDVEKAAAAWGE